MMHLSFKIYLSLVQFFILWEVSMRKKRKSYFKYYFLLFIITVILLISIPFRSVSEVDIPKQSTGKISENKADETKDSNTIDKTEWNLLLANQWNKLPVDFNVELTNLSNGHAIDKRAYPDLQQMMDDARREGLSPIICSSFRTQEKQQTLFNKEVYNQIANGYSQEKAEIEASKWVAVPGTSEHQTGLAVDIVSSNYQILDKQQEETAEQKWLMQNSYKYGFILRYLSEKSEITGIGYEPWHYRYVGKKAAKEIYKSGVCLEEYLEM